MKFLQFACFAALVPLADAAANFKATCNSVNNQMNALNRAIGQVQAVAQQLGHTRIASKCNEASSHLSYAQTAWLGISSGFNSFPWQARSSSHARTVQGRLASCGGALNWIYGQPELRHPSYRPPVSSCQSNYNGCNTGCQSVWNWPSPPGYGPKPSQANGGYAISLRKRQPNLCPLNEEACPISRGSFGIECLDTTTEITSCGGCVSNGMGENCLEIPGAEGVGCLEGVCHILSTKPGYTKNEAGRPELA